MQFKIVRFQKLLPAPRASRQAGGMPPEIKPGAGDLIAKVAKPIARQIDRVFGTRLRDCESCEERRQWLNEHFGF